MVAFCHCVFFSSLLRKSCANSDTGCAKIIEDQFPPSNSITPYPEATSIVVGNAYYTLSRFMPRGMELNKTCDANTQPNAAT